MFGGWSGEWHGDMISMDIGNIVGPPYAIMGLEPDRGPITGGVPLTIKGIDFVESDQITVRFLIPGGRGKKFQDVEGEFINDSTLQCMTPEFTMYNAGSVQIRVSLGRNGFTTTFQKYSFFSVTDAARTMMYGPGLTNGTSAGCQTTYIVESRDSDGQRRITPGDEYTIIVEHETGAQVPADVVYLDQGRYTVSFDVPNEGGKYNISTVFEGTFGGEAGHIRGSPHQVTYASLPNSGKDAGLAMNAIDSKVMENAVQSDIGNLIAFAKKTLQALTAKVPANDQLALLNVMEKMHQLEQRKAEMELRADRLTAQLVYLIEIGKASSTVPRSQSSIEEWRNMWAACVKRAPDCRVDIGPLIQQESARTTVDISTFAEELDSVKQQIKQMRLWSFDTGYQPSLRMIEDAVGEHGTRHTKYEKLLHISSMLGLGEKCEVAIYDKLMELDDMLKFAKLGWDITNGCTEYFEKCHSELWSDIDADVMEEKAKILLKKVRGQNRSIKWCNVFTVTEQKVKDFLATCPLIVALRHKSMRPRHWKMLMTATGKEFVPPYEDEELMLGGLLALNLHEFGVAVDDITDQAQKEEKMESNLAGFESNWASIDWLFDNFTTHSPTNPTSLKLVKINDEDFEALEADQLTCMAMLGSRYLATFETRVNGWNKKLSNVADVVNNLNEIQRLWSYLEPLFIGSEEVKKELPNDAMRFDKVNTSVMNILKACVQTGNICDSCNKDGLVNDLNGVATDLDLCKKSLKEFLDGKRAIFPRFYFVSEAQLLDLLSNGSTPHKIIKYTTAVFLATKTLVLDPPEYSPGAKTREWYCMGLVEWVWLVGTFLLRYNGTDILFFLLGTNCFSLSPSLPLSLPLFHQAPNALNSSRAWVWNKTTW
jgi:dynein heavy chain